MCMYTIETKRCIIRPFKFTDLDDFYEYASKKGVGEHAGWMPHDNKAISENILTGWVIEGTGIEFAIEFKENHKVIGSFGVMDKADRAVAARTIGYVLSKEYWNMGIMSEVCEAMLAYIFTTLRMEMVTVSHYDYNQRSKRVIEKNGFKLEGVSRKARKNGEGKIVDIFTYSLLKEEWGKNNKKTT